jgi:hypothetical protein
MEYSLVSNNEFKRYKEKDIPQKTKRECFDSLPKDLSFDYALPRTWLDKFVEESSIAYMLVLSTTV